TALNVIALLAAIPTTILYKALNGAAPFPDESSVNDFKATFTAQWMFDAAGLGTTRATERAVALPDPKFRSKLRVVCGSMTIISGVFAAALDSVSGVATMEESGLTENLPYEFFSMAGLLMNFGVQGCNCPYIFEESPHWAVKTVWLYETIGSLGLDLIFFVKGQV